MAESINLMDLWRRTCQDDEDAYNGLHNRLFPELYHYIFQIVKDQDLTHDLLQDLFIQMWEKRHQLGVINNVRAYLYRASRCAFINYYRKMQRQQDGLLNYEWDEVGFSIEDSILYSEQCRHVKFCLDSALEKLPSRQRQMIYLRYFEELDYERISALTGLKYQSVVNHIYRAVQLLRLQFKTVDIYKFPPGVQKPVDIVQ